MTAQPRYIKNEAPLSVYIEVAYEQIAATRHNTDRLNGTRRYDADIARALAILNRDADRCDAVRAARGRS